MKRLITLFAIVLAGLTISLAGQTQSITGREPIDVGRRALWLPRDAPGALVWLDSYRGLVPGTTPAAQGTTPPVVTVTWASPAVDANGILTSAIDLYVKIDLLGTVGVATFRYSVDRGSTFIATGVATASTVALTGAASGITVAFPAGTYATDDTYTGTTLTWKDGSGRGNDFTDATVARQPDFVASGTNSKPCLRGGRAVSVGLANAGVALGSSATIVIVATPSTSASRYLYSGASNGSAIISDFSSKNYEWFGNGTDRYTFSSGGTGLNIVTVTQVNSGALVGYFNGAQVFSQTATHDLENAKTILDQGARGASAVADMTAFLVWNRVLSAPELTRVHFWLARRFGVTLSVADPEWSPERVPWQYAANDNSDAGRVRLALGF